MLDFNDNSKLAEAFKHIGRKDFVRPEYADIAHVDTALPIGYDQTISQPTTVAFMLSLLDLRKGLKVLDVGAGSGWTTALLAYLVGKKGEVVGVELIPELVTFGKNNVSKYSHYSNVDIFSAGESIGYPSKAPFDRILVSASADTVPLELIKQLKIGGIMVIPIKNTLCKYVRESVETTDTLKEEYPGFVFVPLKS